MKIYGINIFSLKSICYHIQNMFLSPLPTRIYILQFLMKKFSLGTFEQWLKYEGVDYSAYAYDMYSAAL